MAEAFHPDIDSAGVRKGRLSRLVCILAAGFAVFAIGHGIARLKSNFDGPVVTVRPSEIDLGTVEVGHAVRFPVTIGNVGNVQLLVTDVDSSCQCTAEDLPSRVIEPKGSTQLNVTFTAKSAGKKIQRVLLRTNDPRHSLSIITVRASAIELPAKAG